jgi:trans-aconitate methyltransferase
MNDGEKVRRFYDDFTHSRMAGYRRERNLRIERAIQRILPYLSDNHVVLEVGCGVGVVSEAIVPRIPQGSLWSCDISREAIELASQWLKEPNVTFRTLDIVREFDVLKSWIPRPVDLILMIDVLEHVPASEHDTLFRNLRSIMQEESTLILTFPSPQYQQYLSTENPQELQIVDETIEVSDILRLASNNGLGLKHYSVEDVWLNNQYVHCVLQTGSKLRKLRSDHDSLDLARQEIESLVPESQAFILADEDQWALRFTGARRAIPFTEKDGQYWGQYWGPPADDQSATHEFERLRRAGASFAVFASPAFWWLEHYAALSRHLEAQFRCVLKNDRLIVFDLRP